MATIPNIDPFTSALVFKKEIKFSTTDEISGQSIIEGYTVSSPTNSSITSVTLTGGKKCVVPITSDNGSGAPYLKFHFPNGTSANKIYLTFAVKNSEMADGYYDYKTGIPSAYRSKLKQFIISHLGLSAQFNTTGTKSKELRFTAYGSSTNKPAEAVVFKFVFSGLFSGTQEANNNQQEDFVQLGTSPINAGTGMYGVQLQGTPGRVIGG